MVFSSEFCYNNRDEEKGFFPEDSNSVNKEREFPLLRAKQRQEKDTKSRGNSLPLLLLPPPLLEESLILFPTNDLPTNKNDNNVVSGKQNDGSVFKSDDKSYDNNYKKSSVKYDFLTNGPNELSSIVDDNKTIIVRQPTKVNNCILTIYTILSSLLYKCYEIYTETLMPNVCLEESVWSKCCYFYCHKIVLSYLCVVKKFTRVYDVLIRVLTSYFLLLIALQSSKSSVKYFKSNTSRIISIILITIALTSDGADGIRISSLDVPHHFVSGNDVKLFCHYELQNDILYSVKWYRGIKEFFRFEPKASSPIKIFDIEGIVVDTSLSDKNQVTLRSVTREASGKYKCEVSADTPTFHTVSKVAEMLVVDMPQSVPNITGGRPRYHVGEEVYVNCTWGKSRPASSLMWYINDNLVSLKDLVEYTPTQTEDGFQTSRLGLKFIVGAKDFPNGVLKIKCTGTIASVYFKSSEEAVEGQLPQTSPALESKGVYTGEAVAVYSNYLTLLTTSIVLLLFRDNFFVR